MRSRAVSRPLACWFSIALAPPPSQIFSPSLRTCDIRSAKKRMLASYRAEVGSTFVVSTFPGADELLVEASLRLAMGQQNDTRTDYGIPRGLRRAMQASSLASYQNVQCSW